MANVPDEESPLASGMPPARVPRLGETGRSLFQPSKNCQPGSAGDMTEVPKGRGLSGPLSSKFMVISLFKIGSGENHQRENERDDKKEDDSQIDPGD